VSGDAEEARELRTASTVRRALGETLPEAVATARLRIHHMIGRVAQRCRITNRYFYQGGAASRHRGGASRAALSLEARSRERTAFA
jgi:hypothetical protein